MFGGRLLVFRTLFIFARSVYFQFVKYFEALENGKVSRLARNGNPSVIGLSDRHAN